MDQRQERYRLLVLSSGSDYKQTWTAPQVPTELNRCPLPRGHVIIPP